MRRLGVVAFAAAVGLCPGLQTTRAPAPPAQTRRRTNTPPKNGNGVPIATTSLGANPTDDDWWTPFLVRPGQDEAYAILSDFQRGEAADDAFDHAVHGAKFLDDPESGAFPTRRAVLSNVLEGEVSSSWWGAILEAFDKTSSSESELFDAAWQRVRADLGPAGADVAGDMLVAVAGDFRALPLLLVRHLEKLHEECGSAAAAREASLLEAASEHIKATVPNVKPSTRGRDALDVLAPLADRFGLNQLKNDLEDAAFERLAPATRSQILKALDRKRDDRSVVRGDVSARLRRLMVEDDVLMNAVESLRVSTREKEPYSAAWQPLQNRTKDYVARPKANGYQSLHTTVLMRLHGASYPFEVQIRTRDMHLVAEFGSAAHALYSGARPAPVPVAPPPPREEEAAVEVPGEPLEGEAESSAIGARLGKSMGDRLRAERIFVLASGGRVLTVGANDNAVDVRKALLRDLEHDAGEGALVTGGGLWLDDERARGHLEINGKRLGGSSRVDEASTARSAGSRTGGAHGELEETPRP
ncbi:hypothetical protein JL722_1092 [Aureococcus anophagefferens]|nr:hypothetical protein JL722_1092 [Aureococcus anophagefferens]